MHEAGLTPGRDLSIVGYDNIEHRQYGKTNGQLTTIDNPKDQVGRRIGEMLLNQLLRGQRDIVAELVPTTLIVRNTTGPCMTA